MEEYTINNDLKACGLPGGDEDDLASGGEALFGSSAAPINVDGGDDAGAAGGAGAGTPEPSTMPSSTPSINTCTSIRLKRVKSGAWNDFDKIFETLPTGKKRRESLALGSSMSPILVLTLLNVLKLLLLSLV
ncbi:hypothetical protein GQ55_7G301400 [Panicum hallii var. hallii]|uniref:Uncharacterized protein n=1 Tax=Panicum hallii var. hallii TaxID=1504633 RepID=A0A2T7D0W6_9POAL|nr:hypothetical protein GQ55_7G301400 [Panicum hallii var. hallii]